MAVLPTQLSDRLERHPGHVADIVESDRADAANLDGVHLIEGLYRPTAAATAIAVARFNYWGVVDWCGQAAAAGLLGRLLDLELGAHSWGARVLLRTGGHNTYFPQ